MAQPDTYNRQKSFTLLASQNPSTPYTGADLDSEFNAVKVTMDEVLANLALIQRSDGQLANLTVGNDQLSATVNLGFNPPTAWVTAHAYTTRDCVFNTTIFYRCLVAHTSGTFATDLAAAKWVQVADFSAVVLGVGSVGTTNIADLGVTTAKMALLAVSTAQLATNAVTTSKITDANVTTAKIADANVTTAKILDANVTLAKMANMATASFLGRNTAGTGVPEVLSATVSTAILNALVGDSGSGGTKGLVPAPAAGDAAAGKVFKASGAWGYPVNVPTPQGRLTLTSGLPVLAADVIAATSVLYTPSEGNLASVYDGTGIVTASFAELTLTLAAQHALNSLYDVFLIINAGAAILATGPAWTVAGNFVSAGSLTTGTAARGTGAATTELQRHSLSGFLTNKNSMTARNGASTYTVAANQGTYLGTIWTDATAGQVTCHATFGQNRKFGVWNAFNRKPIVLIGGDGTASWTYGTNAYRKANNTGANSLTMLAGLAEEWAEGAYHNEFTVANGVVTQIAIGAGSFTVASGAAAVWSGDNAGTAAHVTALARYAQAPFLGLQSLTALELANGGTITFVGTSASMELRAGWRG